MPKTLEEFKKMLVIPKLSNKNKVDWESVKRTLEGEAWTLQEIIEIVKQYAIVPMDEWYDAEKGLVVNKGRLRHWILSQNVEVRKDEQTKETYYYFYAD